MHISSHPYLLQMNKFSMSQTVSEQFNAKVNWKKMQNDITGEKKVLHMYCELEFQRAAAALS